MDPNLFDILHSNNLKLKSQPKKEKSAITQNPEDNLAFEEAVKNEVKRLLSMEDSNGNQLLPMEARRAKIEQEVREDSDFSDLSYYLSSTFTILIDEGATYLSREEDEILQENLTQLCENLKNMNLKDLTEERMKAAMELPKECQNLILGIAIKKFQEKKLEDSLAIFMFLATVDEDEPDYWYRLGLIAQIAGNYDLALEAFEKTSRLAPEFVGAHLHCAECYLSTGKRVDASAELTEAKKHCLENHQGDEWNEQVHKVERLLAECS